MSRVMAFRSVVALLCVLCVQAFRYLSPILHSRRSPARFHSSESEFDGRELDQILSSVGDRLDGIKQDKEAYNAIKEATTADTKEDIHRTYPYEQQGLPVLPDCNNYYSGSHGDIFWHQNADQVFMYIPVDNSVGKSDVKVNFEAKKVTVYLRSQEVVMFPCAERIIPDGSFWLFETDKDGKKYIQLDMEKRFRMINWKGIFSRETPETSAQQTQKRAEILEKLFAANQGMSKLSGVPPESMREMMSNGDLTRMIADEIYAKPQVSTIDEQGQESEVVEMGGNIWEGDISNNSDMGHEGEEQDEADVHGLNLKSMPILEGEIVEGS